MEEPTGPVTVRMASALTGAACGTIRAAVRRGAVELVGVIEGGPYARDRWLLDYASVLEWHRRSGLPAPVPADPLELALDGSLLAALDRDLALRALERVEAERRRLTAERRAVQAARARLTQGR